MAYSLPFPSEDHPGDPETLICYTFYSHNIFIVLIPHLLILLTLCLMMKKMFKFYQRIYFFPFVERAPYLTMTQAISMLLTVLVPYIVEIIIKAEIDWKSSGTVKDIPISRKFMKALYTTVRIGNYSVYILRYILNLFKTYQNLRELES
jgi:hypothetical protein